MSGFHGFNEGQLIPTAKICWHAFLKQHGTNFTAVPQWERCQIWKLQSSANHIHHRWSNCLNDKFLAHYNCFLDSDIVMPSWPSSKDRRLIELDFLPTLWIDNFNVSNNLFRSKDSHTNLYALLLFQRGRNITQTIRAQLPQNETCQAAQTGHVTKNTWVQCRISL